MKLIRRIRSIVFGSVALLMGVYSHAEAEKVEYSVATFEAAAKSGEPFVLDFHASWCPTCRAQSKSFDVLLTEPKFAPVKILRVDFDAADELKSRFKVQSQSTLILLKDGKEIDRVGGVTSVDGLRAFVEKGLVK